MRRVRWLLLGSLAACSSTNNSWLGEHFDAQPWGRALTAQVEQPDHLALEVGLLGATGLLATQDHRLQSEASEDRSITQSNTNNGDGTAVGLGVLAAGVGVADWAGGDHAHSLEVLLESVVVTEGITEGLKSAVGRERPTHDSTSSFPSGHSSYAFTMATYLQRCIADAYDGWVGDLGYLAYLPAAYVGINRVEANRHWPSDVAFGAFLGVFVTNVVYDAHYGVAGQPGIFGVKGLGLEPEQTVNGGSGLALVWHF